MHSITAKSILPACLWPATVAGLLLSLLPVPGYSVESNSPKSLYRLGTGDMVRIQVYDEEDLYLEAKVSDNGTISYPFLGELKVAGLSPAQLEKVITSRLKGDYLVNPKVSVDILEYRQFYVNGEVEEPGGFPFQPGITVRKAISVAGGFKERASKKKIYIIHDDNPQGKPVKISLDAQVRPGDIITVEESFF
ncbi:MAG: polysaccharide biosynthesis/export family protein [Gammaproteobacteria bacterium]